jgi:phospholipase C
MGYFTADDLPFYWDLYQTFAMSDHHHCSVLGPTWVNRWFFMSGTSFGNTRHVVLESERLQDPPYVGLQLLDDAGVDWRVYYSDAPFALSYVEYFMANRSRMRQYVDHFFDDLEAGELASVVYIDPSFTHGVTQTDEHPPSDPQIGHQFVAQIVEAVMASEIWESTAIILTYDEHGGFYDHVAPPEACVPGDYPPDLLEGDYQADFDRLGFRVPLVVVSPYSRAGYVSDRTTDLTSVLRLIQTRFLLPALTGRDANAWPLLDMFDFENPPFMTPPDLADAVIDPGPLEACEAEFGR